MTAGVLAACAALLTGKVHVTAVDPRPPVDRPPVVVPAVVPAGARSLRTTLGAFVALTKPRIIELLLVTTIPTMFLAEGGVPRLWLVAATLVGGALAAGSANTLNCYLDRDIDAMMKRTGHRPLATGAASFPPSSHFALGSRMSPSRPGFPLTPTSCSLVCVLRSPMRR